MCHLFETTGKARKQLASQPAGKTVRPSILKITAWPNDGLLLRGTIDNRDQILSEKKGNSIGSVFTVGSIYYGPP